MKPCSEFSSQFDSCLRNNCRRQSPIQLKFSAVIARNLASTRSFTQQQVTRAPRQPIPCEVKMNHAEHLPLA